MKTMETAYHEAESAKDEFDRTELRRLRLLLRRLHFLEEKVRENGGLQSDTASGGGAWAEWEMEATEWILLEVGFLREVREPKR